VDAGQPHRLQSQTGQTRQIGLEFAIGLSLKHGPDGIRAIIKGAHDLSADLEGIGANARPKPGQHVGHIAASLGQV
jgi:hypothetical protein